MGALRSLRTISYPAVVTLGFASGCPADDSGEGVADSTTSSTGDASTGAGTDAGPDTGSTAAADGDTGVVDDDGSGEGSSSTGSDNSGLIDDRPYGLVVPASYDPESPTPLVVLLHGYGATAPLQDVYFRFTPNAEANGYLLALPNGLKDAGDSQFWNATDACCNFGNDPVDDVAYLEALIDDVAAQYNVDDRRVYFVGHSNGGFMAHRLACEIGDRIAAIVSLAGATWNDAAACPAQSPVNILQVHGTDDETIAFDGGNNGGVVYPSASDTVAQWAAANGCGGELVNDSTADLEVDIDGAETIQDGYMDCPPGGQVALWTIDGGGHIPSFDESWAEAVWAYLAVHPKPLPR